MCAVTATAVAALNGCAARGWVATTSDSWILIFSKYPAWVTRQVPDACENGTGTVGSGRGGIP